MRLIDADALDYALGASDEDIYFHHMLEDAPTIPAIPLEWLNEKMQKPQITCDNPFGFVLAEWLEEQI